MAAIGSGLVASFLVETLHLGTVAPFDLAILVLLAGWVLILGTWEENYGERDPGAKPKYVLVSDADGSTAVGAPAPEGRGQAQAGLAALTGHVVRAAQVVLRDRKVAALGACQALFEGECLARGRGHRWTPISGADNWAAVTRLASQCVPVHASGHTRPDPTHRVRRFRAGAMYCFVFLWTPALEAPASAVPAVIPHGTIFACFMCCSMVGSSLAEGLLESADTSKQELRRSALPGRERPRASHLRECPRPPACPQSASDGVRRGFHRPGSPHRDLVAPERPPDSAGVWRACRP